MPPFLLPFLMPLAGIAEGWLLNFFTKKVLGEFIVWLAKMGYVACKVYWKKTASPDDDQWIPRVEEFVRFIADVVGDDITDWKP
jgi:hypothetical protein